MRLRNPGRVAGDPDHVVRGIVRQDARAGLSAFSVLALLLRVRSYLIDAKCKACLHFKKNA